MVFITYIILLFSLQAQVSYGIDTRSNCTTANASCSECYQTLVKNVVHDNDNIFSLLRTFFPPNDYPPVFVIVEYHFEDSNTTFTYFWTLKSSFFIVPLNIFRFLSLFFGTPVHHLNYVSLTLRLPSECEEANPEYFEMLTYLLKAYAATQSATPRLVNEYTTGRGANAETIRNVYIERCVSALIISYSVLLSLLGSSIIAFVIIQHRVAILDYLGRGDDGSAIKISIVVVCTAFYLYVVALDFAANIDVEETPPAMVEYYIGAIQVLPAWVLIFDTFILPHLVLLIFCIYIIKDSHAFSVLIVVSITVVACILTNHSLYITISFINDPYHATGVTVYYIIFIFIHLVVLKKIILLVLHFSDSLCVIFVSVIVIFLIVLGLQILCTFLYIKIPIKDAIDDIPHQLQSLLQLLTTFFVGLITYKFLEKPGKVQNEQSLCYKE